MKTWNFHWKSIDNSDDAIDAIPLVSLLTPYQITYSRFKWLPLIFMLILYLYMYVDFSE